MRGAKGGSNSDAIMETGLLVAAGGSGSDDSVMSESTADKLQIMQLQLRIAEAELENRSWLSKNSG